MSLLAARLGPVALSVLRKNPIKHLQKTSVRNAGTIMYRSTVFQEPKVIHYAGTAISAFMWYWILYHCYFEFDHLVPDHVFPDPEKYTDEELGIPPDDEE